MAATPHNLEMARQESVISPRRTISLMNQMILENEELTNLQAASKTVLEKDILDHYNSQFNDSTLHKYISAEPILLNAGQKNIFKTPEPTSYIRPGIIKKLPSNSLRISHVVNNA
jgi:hypothetical protein